MSLCLFNSLTKRKEPFSPIEEGKVRMYTCGPTVYGRPHIGNYASFLMADLLRRWLEVSGYKVTHVKNITDVGHLSLDSSADAGGEDKIERQAKAEKTDPLAIAKKYTEQYLADERKLNFLEPAFRPRATETISEMIEIIQNLLASGHAYETLDGIYFSVERFPGYGKLSGNTLANLGKLMANQRTHQVEISEKRHSADFALWKKCVGENAAHLLRWSFPEGKRLSGAGEDPKAGFPGWHIECSAMSVKYLAGLSGRTGLSGLSKKFDQPDQLVFAYSSLRYKGATAGEPDQPDKQKTEGMGFLIDIHTGGEDNIFPHHECEIAQSEAAFGVPFVKYWLHKRRVNFADVKMSKSLGNVLSLSDIEEKGFSPMDMRYFFFSSHYRSHTQFSWKGLSDAAKARRRVGEWIGEVLGSQSVRVGLSGRTGLLGLSGLSKKFDQPNQPNKPNKPAQQNELVRFMHRFIDAMNDDLNTPEAFAAVFDLMAWSRREQGRLALPALTAFVETLERTFGCFCREEISIPDDVKAMMEEREEARKAKNFARSDELRAEIQKSGFVVEDGRVNQT